jgi:hypothetical protein
MGATACNCPASCDARNPFRGTGPWLYWADAQRRFFNANPDVIDPLGNLMLRYPRDPDPRRMIKDLTRLLKVSRVG